MILTCAHCQDKFYVSECRGHLTHCSRDCYEASLLLDPAQIGRMARMGLSRMAAAKTLDIPYPSFYRKLRRQGLNNLFPTIARSLTRAEERAVNS